MKPQKTLSPVAIALAAVLALASCNPSDDLQPDGPQAIRFNAGIGPQAVATPQTRATGTIWNSGDAIGIFMLKNKETAVASTYAANKKFTTGAASLFRPVSGHEIYFPLDVDRHTDFIAYYPYTDTDRLGMDSQIPVSTADQTRQPAFDVMWARADNNGEGYNKNFRGNIPLVFRHRLARLTMNCKFEANTGITAFDSDATVTLRGMNTATTFAVRDGALGTPATPADMVARKAATATGYAGTYDAIIVPDTSAAGTVTGEFYVNHETYVWKMDATTFASGNDYVYDVLITRTGVTATGSITPWTTETQGPVYAE